MTISSTRAPGATGHRPPPGDGPLVVGLGNVLLGDDGFGPAVCDELRRWQSGVHLGQLPAETRLLDGGTLGSALVPWLVDARAVVIVDAVDIPGTPGSLRVWRAPELATGADGGIGPAGVVAMAILGGLPREALSIVGVIPTGIQPGIGLSRAVRTAVPQAALMVAQEIRKLMGGIGGEAGSCPC